MSEKALKIRKDLRDKVRKVWESDDAWYIRTQLKKEAIQYIRDCYSTCARNKPGKEFRSCLESCANAENVKIGYKYEQIWGTAPKGA